MSNLRHGGYFCQHKNQEKELCLAEANLELAVKRIFARMDGLPFGLRGLKELSELDRQVSEIQRDLGIKDGGGDD